MRRFLSVAMVASALLVAAPAFAQYPPPQQQYPPPQQYPQQYPPPQQTLVAGNVYQTAPNGMYVQNSNGIVFVPSAQASFRIGGVAVNLAAGPPVAVGAPVQVYVAPSYPVQYIPTPVFQSYWQSHRNWDWNHHLNQWHSEQRYWVNEHGNWHDNRRHEEHRDHHDHGHGHGH